jgi:quercetin dioxygenase-like cupin family protein
MHALTETTTVKTETLLSATSTWDNSPYAAYPTGSPQITVCRITIAPHGELAWHQHPMPSAAYIVSGEITVEDQGGKQHHFTAGEVIPETVNALHRGIVGDQPAIFIVFYAGVKDMPLAQRSAK